VWTLEWEWNNFKFDHFFVLFLSKSLISHLYLSIRFWLLTTFTFFRKTGIVLVINIMSIDFLNRKNYSIYYVQSYICFPNFNLILYHVIFFCWKNLRKKYWKDLTKIRKTKSYKEIISLLNLENLKTYF